MVRGRKFEPASVTRFKGANAQERNVLTFSRQVLIMLLYDYMCRHVNYISIYLLSRKQFFSFFSNSEAFDSKLPENQIFPIN